MTTKKIVKVEDWPAATVEKLKTLYTGAECNDKLDGLIAGKTSAQVRGKLVSLGIYVKGEPKAVGGASSVRKTSIVKAIEIFAGLPAGSLESLEKASKPQLDLLAGRLTELSDQYNASMPADQDEPDEPVTSGM